MTPASFHDEQESLLTEDTNPTPVEANVTAAGFGNGGPAPANDPTFMNGVALAILAQHVPPITWTFDETAKVYNGTAPYGTFVLARDPETSRLYSEFKSTCETHSSRTNLNETTVADAKAAVLPHLLDSLNQSRRLNLVIPDPAAPAPVVPEPDLI